MRSHWHACVVSCVFTSWAALACSALLHWVSAGAARSHLLAHPSPERCSPGLVPSALAGPGPLNTLSAVNAARPGLVPSALAGTGRRSTLSALSALSGGRQPGRRQRRLPCTHHKSQSGCRCPAPTQVLEAREGSRLLNLLRLPHACPHLPLRLPACIHACPSSSQLPICSDA